MRRLIFCSALIALAFFAGVQPAGAQVMDPPAQTQVMTPPAHTQVMNPEAVHSQVMDPDTDGSAAAWPPLGLVLTLLLWSGGLLLGALGRMFG